MKSTNAKAVNWTKLSRFAVAVAALSGFTASGETKMEKTDEGIVVSVDANAMASWSELFAASGLTAADCSGQKLIKTGDGTFNVGSDDPQTVGISGVEIRDGRYLASGDPQFGSTANKNVSVAEGATLVLDYASDSVRTIASRTVTLAGSGTSREYPAVRIERHYWGLVDGINLNLADDTTIFSNVKDSGGTIFFRYCKPDAAGHTLTLDGVEGSGYRFACFTTWSGGGTVRVCAGKFISAAANHGDWVYRVSGGNYPQFEFESGAELRPDNGDVFGLIKRAAFAPGSAIVPKAGSATVCAFNELAGTPTVSADAAELSIANAFTIAQDDLLADCKLTVAEALVFGDDCTFSVPDFGPSMVDVEPGTELTVATAATITGTPALDALTGRFFDLVSTGTALKLVRKVESKSIVFLNRDCGCVPGPENAVANAETVLGWVPGFEDDTIIFVEGGDYWCENGFDFTGLNGSRVTIASFDPQQPAVFHSPVLVGASAATAIESLVFRELSGPAVIANGTQGLTIRDCVLSGVVGTWTDGQTYPYVFTAVADLLVTGCGYSGEVSPAWAAPACLTEGSQLPLSEVQAGALVVNVASGESKTWATTFAESGLAAEAVAGLSFVKIGLGEFKSKNTDDEVAMRSAGITGVVIRQGRYSVANDQGFGVAGGTVSVEDGATLVLRAAWGNIGSRRVELSGTGSSREYPTVRVESYPGALVDGATWVLNSDVTFYLAQAMTSANNCDVFNYTHVYGNGHALTLDGVEGAAYRIRNGALWHQGGSLVVNSGVRLLATAQINETWKYRVYDSAPLFLFKSGSSFEPASADIFGLIKRMAFESPATFAPSAAMEVVVDELTGAPTVGANVSSLTINRQYAVRQADVLADCYLDCPGTLVFGADASVGADEATGIAGKTAFHAAGGVSGVPKRSDSLKAAHVVLERQDAYTWGFENLGFVLMIK